MRRVVVMGPPGSGKSRLARRLGAKRGLPVFHLDQAYWRPGWVEAPPEAFAAEVARLAALPAWAIDGNDSDRLAPRLAAANTVIYLDVPPWLSALRVLRRTLRGHGARAGGRGTRPSGAAQLGLPALRLDLEPLAPRPHLEAAGELPGRQAGRFRPACDAAVAG